MEKATNSQVIRTEACDWVIANLYSPGANFDQCFERLAEILAVMNMGSEGTQLDLVEIVQGHPSFRPSSASRNFDSYLRWLKSGKSHPTQSLLEYEAFIQIHIVLKYGPKLEKAFCFQCLHWAAENLKNLKSPSSRWGLGLVSYLQSRVNLQHPGPQTAFVVEQLLTKSEKDLLTVARQLKTQKIEGFSETLRFRHYIIACVFALHQQVDKCVYCLVKAKNLGAIPPLPEILANPDFEHVKHSYTDFEYVLKEPSQYTRDRFAYESDRRKYIKKQGFLLDGGSPVQGMSASSLLSESSLFRDTMSRSTLETLSGGKLDLMVNLKAFFEPVRSTESTAAHARLKERMELYGYEARREIPGDGNCQMYSLSDQLTGSIKHAAHIRRVLVRWLRTHSDVQLQNGSTIKDFIYDKKFEDYCCDMATDRTWGDHLTLIAAAEVFCARVVVISSIPGDNFVVEINPTLGFNAVTLENSTIGSVPEQNLIALSHFAEFHYGSIHPIQN